MKRTISTIALAAVLAATMPAHAFVTSQKQNAGWSQGWNSFLSAISPKHRASQQRGSAYMDGARAVDRRHSTTGSTTIEQNDRALARLGQAHRISDRTRREEALAAENMVDDHRSWPR